MRIARPLAVAVLVLLPLSATPTAIAHGGHTPFENCTEAYENGHANIPVSSPHYAKKLDRDNDGVGCDQPPSDFVPASEEEETTTDETTSTDESTTDAGENLAETGGNSVTPYIAGAGALLLVGGGVLVYRRRRTN